MAKQYALVAGLTVLATATTISWIFNYATKTQLERREKEMAKADSLRAKAAARRKEYEDKHDEQLQKIALEHSAVLFDGIKKIRESYYDVPAELEVLQQTIDQEVLDKTSSPYRKSALRREYTRIEDARIRMQEYFHYLNYEEKLIKSLLTDKAYAELIQLNPVEILLPVEWLYVGKLVLVSLNELEQDLPRFKHSIYFEKKEEVIQKTLAIPYGDEIPILIKGVDESTHGLFYGCVARGITYYDHIMLGEPLEFKVKWVQAGKNAIGDMHKGALKAYLPIAELKHPNIRLIPGQTLQVHPSTYDLCLTKNPFDQTSRSIEVSEFNYKERSQLDYQQLYIEVNEDLLENISDERFYDIEEHWTLLDYCLSSGVISLAKSTVRLECKVREDGGMLEVQTITQSSGLLVGLDTPFRFTLIGRDLSRLEHISWEFGVQAFIQFCNQTAVDMLDSPEKIAQGRFYQQWEKVISYQREQEESVKLEFALDMAEISDGVLSLYRDRLPAESRDKFDKLTNWLKEILSEKSYLSVDRCVSLQHWDGERREYVPILRNNRYSRSSILYTLETDKINIEADFSLLDENRVKMLLLQINVPNIALQRQSQALDDFFQDRLVNPALKNILLAPEHYLPQQVELDRPIKWAGQLDSSQKRVVNLALRERNIALIQGPPGAGKTTAIVEMLYQLFTHNPQARVLLVSQQNTAVDNALSKFLSEYDSYFKHTVYAIRIGNTEKMSTDVQAVSFDNQYADLLKDLETRAIEASVRFPREESELCLAWCAALKQNSMSRSGQDEFFITLLTNRNLVGATCVGLASNKGGIDQLKFDVAIIDEAGRATVPEILIPILRSQKVILVGDHYQLPPSVSPLLREDDASEALDFLTENFLSGSFFETMFERLPEQCREVLDKQYRMAPAIGNLVATLFYHRNNKRTLFNGLTESDFEDSYLLEECIYWVDVKGQQRRPRNSTSYENVKEAESIVDFLSKLASQLKNLETSISVAVITPYGAQKECIRRQLTKRKNIFNKLTVDVNTIDAFQGSEADIVCYSTVRTQGNLNFILDRQRLNVACSRAKKHLLFFGNSHYLSRWRSRDKTKGINLFSEIVKYASKEEVKFRIRE